MKKYSFLIICTLLTGLLFTTCEPWIVPEAVFVNFNANGGQGDMKALRFMDGEKQSLTKNTYTRNGYIFDGWNTRSDGRGQSYTDRQNVSITKSVTLYAQWRQKQVISGTENGHDYVDLGLPSGLKWATCNVGATAPEGYGDYFAWGETSPKDNYDWSTYKYCNGSYLTLTKYNTKSDYGTVDNKTTLDLSDDAARANWGGKWRMPTKAEHDELIKNCTWTWTIQDGVKGYKVASRTNGNSIFLPAAGSRYGTSVDFVGSSGGYWSSSLSESDPYFAFLLYFISDYVDWCGSYRDDGHPVRAVCGNNTAAQTFTLTFNANGGTGTMAAQTFEAGVSQAITANTFTRSGYTFTGWNTNADGSGTSYTDKQSITLSQDMTLYAQWEVIATTGIENGHEWVDLGLPSGLKWATCNVGATTPEGYGDYFAWGETSPKNDYSWSTYKYCNGSETSLTKYNTSSDFGTVDDKTLLEFSDDAARANWGGKWRMPTNSEVIELNDNCSWTWTTQNGVSGYRVTSKTNGNSIFLPEAGYRGGTSVYNVGSHGHYWSSSLYESEPNYADGLYFNSGYVNWGYGSRYYGNTVRAVCGNNTAAQTFTLTFNANGGTGTMAAQTFEAGVSQALAANAFTRSGYTFTGWNTNADGSGTSYTDKQSITLSQNITLYAQWKKVAYGNVEYAQVDVNAAGIEDGSWLSAGTVLAETPSIVMSVGAEDTYKSNSAAANGMTTVRIGSSVLDLAVACQGSTNPKDASGGNCDANATVPASGAFFAFDVKKDGYLYVVIKASSHKTYLVGEEYTLIGYDFAMHTPNAPWGSILRYTLEGEGEYNQIVQGSKAAANLTWPEKIALGEAWEAAAGEYGRIGVAGTAVIKIPVFGGLRYTVNGCATKIIASGYFFGTSEETVVLDDGSGNEVVLF